MAANNVQPQELVDLTLRRMERSGVTISRTVLEVAIRSSMEEMRDQIIRGRSIKLDGIGSINPSWRRISNAFNPRLPYASKLNLSTDPDLKEELNYLLERNPEYRDAVGASEL